MINYNAYRDSAYVQDVPQTVTLNAFQSRSFTAPSGTGTQVAAATGASIGANPTAPGALSAAGVHTVPVNLTVPTTSLFRLNPNPAGGFLIETDPRFANYRIWLGSDYMLAQLALDPNVTQKRLGDGFYEQRLINEQIAQLTGQRFLANYTNEEAQYKALMDAGITYAQQYQLRPGIALSAIQMTVQTPSTPTPKSRQMIKRRLIQHLRSCDSNYLKLRYAQVNDLDPEMALLEVLKIDAERIPLDYADEARHFVDHNECGLAYDVLVFGVERAAYVPTPEALFLIKQAAEQMGITYPNLSC
jgi:hypothetical protein